jgi:hypothetical protein
MKGRGRLSAAQTFDHGDDQAVAKMGVTLSWIAAERSMLWSSQAEFWAIPSCEYFFVEFYSLMLNFFFFL